ncbi:MAG TPA: dihydrodipicolinate synthase family protein [Tepidisphaeraceae bacterium]|nr:dihydrodipicolinate synthase family protein [Tepidisphaeraceae bacterium]
MNNPRFRGCFSIPMTPYDADDRIDEQVLRAQIEFCVTRSAGVCTPVMVSEFETLSEDERRLMIRVPLDQARGRVPVIACCTATNTPLAVRYARFAEEHGAAMLIAMPPLTMRWDFPATVAYFRALAEAVSIPVMIQNAPLHGLSLSASEVEQLCDQIERVCWVKEEASPPPVLVTNLLSRKHPAIRGLMTGHGGLYMPTDFYRGAEGCILACQFCDLLQRLWNLLEAGEESAARDLHEALLPALVLEQYLGRQFSKHIMVRRGIFRNATVRGHTRPLSADDLREIDRCWERLEPLIR